MKFKIPLSAIGLLVPIALNASEPVSARSPEWLRQQTFAEALRANSMLREESPCPEISRGKGWCQGLPTYGNYGGPGWTAGRCTQGPYTKREFDRDSRFQQPVDEADRAFMMHDYEYLKARIDWNSKTRSSVKRRIDAHLVENLSLIDLAGLPCPFQQLFIHAAIEYFSAQAEE